MVSKFNSYGTRGFTLVELLIVVAIIGVLSTIGVPTFRRMIQKAKKSEAKVNLGALFTAESAFRAEYSAFGDNLERMGFEIDGAASNLIYVVGFPRTDGSCSGTYLQFPQDVRPDNTEVLGGKIQTSTPSYYQFGSATAGFNAGNYCTTTAANAGVDIQVDDAAGASFAAAAQGVIAPGLAQNNLGALDIWTINDGRELVNFQDGVQ